MASTNLFRYRYDPHAFHMPTAPPPDDTVVQRQLRNLALIPPQTRNITLAGINLIATTTLDVKQNGFATEHVHPGKGPPRRKLKPKLRDYSKWTEEDHDIVFAYHFWTAFRKLASHQVGRLRRLRAGGANQTNATLITYYGKLDEVELDWHNIFTIARVKEQQYALMIFDKAAHGDPEIGLYKDPPRFAYIKTSIWKRGYLDSPSVIDDTCWPWVYDDHRLENFTVLAKNQGTSSALRSLQWGPGQSRRLADRDSRSYEQDFETSGPSVFLPTRPNYPRQEERVSRVLEISTWNDFCDVVNRLDKQKCKIWEMLYGVGVLPTVFRFYNPLFKRQIETSPSPDERADAQNTPFGEATCSAPDPTRDPESPNTLPNTGNGMNARRLFTMYRDYKYEQDGVKLLSAHHMMNVYRYERAFASATGMVSFFHHMEQYIDFGRELPDMFADIFEWFLDKLQKCKEESYKVFQLDFTVQDSTAWDWTPTIRYPADLRFDDGRFDLVRILYIYKLMSQDTKVRVCSGRLNSLRDIASANCLSDENAQRAIYDKIWRHPDLRLEKWPGLNQAGVGLDTYPRVITRSQMRLDDVMTKMYHHLRKRKAPYHDDEHKPDSAEPHPSGTQPAEPYPSGIQPAEPRPAGTQPAEPRSVGTQPAEPRSVGTQPAEPRSVGTQPAEPRSVGTQPAEPRPSGIQPAEPRPAGTQPAEPRPAGTQPAELRPSGTKRQKLLSKDTESEYDMNTPSSDDGIQYEQSYAMVRPPDLAKEDPGFFVQDITLGQMAEAALKKARHEAQTNIQFAEDEIVKEDSRCGLCFDPFGPKGTTYAVYSNTENTITTKTYIGNSVSLDCTHKFHSDCIKDYWNEYLHSRRGEDPPIYIRFEYAQMCPICHRIHGLCSFCGFPVEARIKYVQIHMDIVMTPGNEKIFKTRIPSRERFPLRCHKVGRGMRQFTHHICGSCHASWSNTLHQLSVKSEVDQWRPEDQDENELVVYHGRSRKESLICGQCHPGPPLEPSRKLYSFESIRQHWRRGVQHHHFLRMSTYYDELNDHRLKLKLPDGTYRQMHGAMEIFNQYDPLKELSGGPSSELRFFGMKGSRKKT